MKMKNMILVIMACFLIFISMSCICACENTDVANTRDASEIIVDDAIDDSMDVIDGGASSDASIDIDGGASSADDSMDVIDGGASSDASIDIDDGDSIIKNMTNDVPKYNNAHISNVEDVGYSFGDVQRLIDNLPSDTVLYLYNDYAMQDKESPIKIFKDITINGNNHKIDAGAKGIIFEIYDGNVALSNLELLNGTAPSTGGAIYVISAKSLKCDNVAFSFNHARNYGGAIFIVSIAPSTFINCTFKNNIVDTQGGGAIRSKNFVNCTDCKFTENCAFYGGAIYSECNVYAESCDFIRNHAQGSVGGAIYAHKGIQLVGDNEFNANEAHNSGGAISSKSDLYVNWDDTGKTTFRSNRANSDNGGAIYSEKNVYVRNGMFDSNFAEDNGGAIFSKGDTYIDWNGNGQTIFKYNKANTDDGGSIYSKGNVYVKNADFSYGYAHDGGAIYAEGNTIIDSSVFNVNHVSHQGGAIYEKSGLSLRGRTSFAANEAGDSGGAIYTRKFDEDVYHATFRYNVAGDDGGAIYIDHENHETFTECDFEDNYAGDEGGAIYLDDGDSHLSLIRNNLVNNKAKSGYTVYNHGNYDDIKDNWHGSTSPNFDNQFKKYRLILKDKVITPSSYAKTRISW